MHRFIKAFRNSELDRTHGAVLVNYADDFVVLCKRDAPAVLDIIRRWFTAIGLELNERKTRVLDARDDSFDFLGYTFKRLHSYKTTWKQTQAREVHLRRWCFLAGRRQQPRQEESRGLSRQSGTAT